MAQSAIDGAPSCDSSVPSSPPAPPPPPPPPPRLLHELHFTGAHGFLARSRRSLLRRLFASPDDGEEVAAYADTVVNLFTLVSTLLLGCPYSMLGSLQSDAWVALRRNLAACASNPWLGTLPWGAVEVDAYLANELYAPISGGLLASIYLCLLTIVLAAFYYLTRPSVSQSPIAAADPEGRARRAEEAARFLAWWRRGRIIVALIFVAMLLAMICTLTLANTYYTNFVTFPAIFCTQYLSRWHSYIITDCVLVAIVSGALYIAL